MLEGSYVAFECQGRLSGKRWLGAVSGKVCLLAARYYKATTWIEHTLPDGRFALEGADTSMGWLYGRTVGGEVVLAEEEKTSASGAKWTTETDSDGFLHLRCAGSKGHKHWLDSHTKTGQVYLVEDAANKKNSGAKWVRIEVPQLVRAEEICRALRGLLGELGELADHPDNKASDRMLELWKENASRVIDLELSESEKRKFTELTVPGFTPKPGHTRLMVAATVYGGYLQALLKEVGGPHLIDSPVPSKITSLRSHRKHEKVFLVHGRDTAKRLETARTLENWGLDVVILHEKPNKGRSILAKLEEEGKTDFAVVLLTPDDKGRAARARKWASRARQNVVFELGFFIAALGSDKVCVLYDEKVELPSDYKGITYIPLSGEWKLGLATELRAAGFDVDL